LVGSIDPIGAEPPVELLQQARDLGGGPCVAARGGDGQRA
jgi:hypothetical protein